jgi:hypothetical protein
MYMAVIFELKVDTYLQECGGGGYECTFLLSTNLLVFVTCTCVLRTLISLRLNTIVHPVMTIVCVMP